MEASLKIPVIESIREIGGRRRVWFVDIWGVMHNGRDAFPDASVATRTFRETGGVVILLSNSPRPSPDLQDQLRQFGVPDEAYDATVSSGDLTRHELAKHKGARVFHLGPERDLPIFDNAGVTLTGPEDADLIVCSGLFDDDVETPDDYVDLLSSLAARKRLMICANPDHKVERGNRLIYCAGALAAAYESLGGETVYAGKPHRPVYELALETAARIAGLRGKRVAKSDILAIGDGAKTDIVGAGVFGVPSVFVASRLHVPEESAEILDAAHLASLFAEEPSPPIAAMRGLRW
ncbi:MAG: TIGR01459 family HAD-type hydrolase [Methyloceanibacter sp.]|uniref:TIGR01459 family HAD-type hydrolase n=1 Tax=Methyloceanibacter sp. TaxID=1965321 RepID=UPI001E1A8E8C|nr:TIGR01459 family HAD-type hydrolase [Methyloceanibacter sp.]MCB1443635.1 TIGR01459 family HAD-type hydrolase [Methyloceanibacter sp.]